MSEFSGRDDFDLRRVVTEVDFQTGRRADESSSDCADPDEDSLGARSLLGQFTASSPATDDSAHRETQHTVRNGAATAHDLGGAEIRWRDAPPPVPARPADCEHSPIDSTPQPPPPTVTAVPDAEPERSLDWRDAAEASTRTVTDSMSGRRLPSRDRLAVDGSAAVGDARRWLASLPRVLVPAVAVAVRLGRRPRCERRGFRRSARPRTATANQANAFDLTAVLSRAVGGISSDLHSLARAVPSARHKLPNNTASAPDT